MQNGRIPNKALKASSQLNARYSARMARLLRGTVWVSKHNNHNQWLRVDLRRTAKVTGIAIQGRENAHWWVTGFWLQFSQDGVYFATYRKWGSNKVRSEASNVKFQIRWHLLKVIINELLGYAPSIDEPVNHETKQCLHDTGSSFIPVQPHPGSILILYICLHDTF